MKLFVLYKIVFDCISLTVSKVTQAILHKLYFIITVLNVL